jgi:hypothetical protein
VFVSKRGAEDEAAGVLTAFEAYGNDYSDGVEKMDVAGTEVYLVGWGGDFYDVIFRKGSTVAGLNNVQGRDRAERMLAQIIPLLD